MKILKLVFFSGVIASSAFVSGILFSKLIKNQKLIDKMKKLTIKKNMSASSKDDD